MESLIEVSDYTDMRIFLRLAVKTQTSMLAKRRCLGPLQSCSSTYGAQVRYYFPANKTGKDAEDIELLRRLAFPFISVGRWRGYEARWAKRTAGAEDEVKASFRALLAPGRKYRGLLEAVMDKIKQSASQGAPYGFTIGFTANLGEYLRRTHSETGALYSFVGEILGYLGEGADDTRIEKVKSALIGREPNCWSEVDTKLRLARVEAGQQILLSNQQTFATGFNQGINTLAGHTDANATDIREVRAQLEATGRVAAEAHFAVQGICATHAINALPPVSGPAPPPDVSHTLAPAPPISDA